MSTELTRLQTRLIEHFQRGFPTTPRPFETIASELGTNEDTVLSAISDLKDKGYLDRIGATYATGRAGASSLAAMEVPDDQLEKIASQVSHFTEINHNYEREHPINLWFVITAPDEDRLHEVLAEIERKTSLPVIDLPLLESYHVDLGFPL